MAYTEATNELISAGGCVHTTALPEARMLECCPSIVWPDDWIVDQTQERLLCPGAIRDPTIPSFGSVQPKPPSNLLENVAQFVSLERSQESQISFFGIPSHVLNNLDSSGLNESSSSEIGNESPGNEERAPECHGRPDFLGSSDAEVEYDERPLSQNEDNDELSLTLVTLLHWLFVPC